MFGRLFILFAILPILEIMLLLNVSDNIGGWNTFVIVVVTAFFGAYFVRREGANTLRDVQLKLAKGEMPGKELSEGLLLLVAGVLLVTPGFITDIVGLLFTLPFTRGPIAAFIVKSFMKSGKIQGGFSFHQQGFNGSSSSEFKQDKDEGSVFDAEFVDKTDAEKSITSKVHKQPLDEQSSEKSGDNSFSSKKDSFDEDEEKNHPK